ncbi:hypothetical protein Taro_047329 [Colocasia esculenta]|uniref:DUF4283 domain-containing protein n=1 Tax=Colocasia esculenta TaxID=4460 RepID=A0A843X3Q0_COLES|nr:hypothetical protein [Colocasia esculenta]
MVGRREGEDGSCRFQRGAAMESFPVGGALGDQSLPPSVETLISAGASVKVASELGQVHGSSQDLPARLHPRHHPSRGRSRGRSSSRVLVQMVSSSMKAWNELFEGASSAPSAGLSLNYVEPVMHGDRSVASYCSQDSQDLANMWNFAIVGYIVGIKAAYNPLKNFIDKQWKPKGSYDLHLHFGGFFVCVFALEEDMQMVLEGFWHIRGHPFILQRWNRDVKMEKAMLTSIPLWISFPNLLLHLWSHTSLSKMGSVLGKPLFMDKMTASKKRLAFARICVLISSDFNFPSEIKVLHDTGDTEDVLVNYEWKPKSCSVCSSFGHPDGSSTLAPTWAVSPQVRPGRREWRSKNVLDVPVANQSVVLSADQCMKDADTSSVTNNMISNNVVGVNPVMMEVCIKDATDVPVDNQFDVLSNQVTMEDSGTSASLVNPCATTECLKETAISSMTNSSINSSLVIGVNPICMEGRSEKNQLSISTNRQLTSQAAPIVDICNQLCDPTVTNLVGVNPGYLPTKDTTALFSRVTVADSVSINPAPSSLQDLKIGVSAEDLISTSEHIIKDSNTFCQPTSASPGEKEVSSPPPCNTYYSQDLSNYAPISNTEQRYSKEKEVSQGETEDEL